MNKYLLLVVGLALSTAALSSQGKPVIVVQAFTTAAGVELPYDMKLMQTQLVPEFKVLLGKQFDIVAEAPATPGGRIYTLDAEITGWRPGNAAKRLVVGLGSGREATDIQFRVTDGSGKRVVERQDTVRTNFFSQSAGSSGTLAHPIANCPEDCRSDQGCQTELTSRGFCPCHSVSRRKDRPCSLALF